MDKKKLMQEDESPRVEPGPSVTPRPAVLPKPATRSLPRRFATRWIRSIQSIGRTFLPGSTDAYPELFTLPLIPVVEFPSARAKVFQYSQENTPPMLKTPEKSAHDTAIELAATIIDSQEQMIEPTTQIIESRGIESPCLSPVTPILTTYSNTPTNEQVNPENIPTTEPSNSDLPPKASATSKIPVKYDSKLNPSKVIAERQQNIYEYPYAPSPVAETDPLMVDTFATDPNAPENLDELPKPDSTIPAKTDSGERVLVIAQSAVTPSTAAEPKPGTSSSQIPPKVTIVEESESKRKKSKPMLVMAKVARACNKLRVWDEVRYGTKIPKDEVDDEFVMEMMKQGKLQHGLKYSKEGDDDKVYWPPENYKAIQVDKYTAPKIEGEEKKKKSKKQLKDDEEMLALLNEMKEKEREAEEMMRRIDRTKAFTGMFSDGYRRIDLVIVITKGEKKPAEQNIKMEFISNLVKHGLEIEVEEGTLPEHSHLLFIKVHAPSKFLHEYAEFFGAKKQFKEKHLEFLKVNSKSCIDRTFKLKYEKEWLKMIRLNYIQPLNYSNRERSYITYMVLRCVPFGENSNYFSINRLIDKKIICDVYALHDGPYYYTENQDYNLVNARQILFYHWAQRHNIFLFQPLTLIQEYFGSKVAFYFAFFEFFTQFLTVHSILGLIVVVLGVLFKNPVYDHYKEKTCDSTEYSCPYCMDMRACAFKNVTDECFKLKLLKILDTDYLILFGIGACVWAATFVIFWNRFEKFYIWLWELKLRPRWPTVRTEYYVNTEIRRSNYTGIIKRYSSYFESIQRMVVVRLIMFFLFAIIVAFVYGVLEFYYMFIEGTVPKFVPVFGSHSIYVCLILLVFGTLLITYILQRLFYHICIMATKYENHRTIEKYERSLILKVFGCTAACTFVVLIYFAYFKGTFYTLPHVRWEPKINFTFNNETKSNGAKFLGKLFQTNCGIFGCLDEAIITYAALVFSKVILSRLWACCMCYKTDYSSLDPDAEPPVIPVWEREYQLIPVTDLEMLDMFTSLLIQFALVTWFVVLFPLAPLIVLVVNIWFLRRSARILLVHSRRPVLYNTVGLGTWNKVLTFIAYTSALTNAVIIAKSTTAITRYTYKTNAGAGKQGISAGEVKQWNGLYENFTVTYFKTEFYKEDEAQNKTFSAVMLPPDYCLFPGLYLTSDQPNVTWDYKKLNWPFHVPFQETNPGNYRPKATKYFKNLFELYFITFFLVLVLVLVLVMKYYIPTITPQIKKVIIIEDALKKVYEKNVLGKKKKPLVKKTTKDAKKIQKK